MTKGRQFVAMVKNKFKSPRPDDSGNIADESEEIWQGGTETSSSAPTDPFVPQTLADLPQLNSE